MSLKASSVSEEKLSRKPTWSPVKLTVITVEMQLKCWASLLPLISSIINFKIMERKLHLWLWHLDIPSAPFLEDVWILQIFLHSENDARGIHSGWEDIANPICQGADVNSRDAFVPPKPKEFDKAALIGISFEAVKGMKASLNTGSGFERFSVSGAIPCNKTGKQQIKKKGHCHWCRQFFSNTNPLICSHDAITEIHKQLICLLQSKWETGPVVFVSFI